jgi:hypothetical protein
MHMDTDLPDRPWWKEPMVWLITVLPLTAVVAGVATYFIAAHEPDSLVRTEYRKEGFAVAQVSDRDRLAASLGLAARLSVLDGQLRVELRGGLGAGPERLHLSLVHPTRENQDMRIVLTRSHESFYVAPVPDAGTGKRTLILEPEDRAWRITGQCATPISGMTELVAEAKNPSTRP